MEKLIVGILAHVDAGKTTLTEAMLYAGGQLRKLGRVDHRNAFLDTDVQERERGITIFSKQAVLPLKSKEITLLDTPGHVDFSSEMERTLQVLDYAVLVISGTDGVQSHTRTLWKLLQMYRVPVLLFINKMDLAGADRQKLLSHLQKELSGGCADFSVQDDAFFETVAMSDESLLNTYLETGTVPFEAVCRQIANRKLFPCFFGSALKLDGVETFLSALETCTVQKTYPADFAAKVYKIAHDAQGTRLTYLKVTGGTLRVKEVLSGGAGDNVWNEKADQLRIYSGNKYNLTEMAPAGSVCAVTGLTHTYPGQGLGAEPDSPAPVLDSFLNYRVNLPPGIEAHTAAQKLRQLQEEDPQLHVVWNEQLREIHVQLMGEVQLEVLQRLIADRFQMQVTFGEGSIVYHETLTAPVEGMGHFEPLRHYAEVHLLLEPGAQGSGLQLDSIVSEDVLDRNWQRLILTHLEERTFPGVLTGSPITDVKITLVAGRAHLKHTEGGDFRQATYRAVRHGLLRGQSRLLEPWYTFRLEVPQAQVGRALSDMERLCAQYDPPEMQGENAVITGSAPVHEMRSYGAEVAGYTHGLGSLLCMPKGYFPCHNEAEVIQQIGYDAERDTENSGDSVFCSHGAGVLVNWREAESHMHLPSLSLKHTPAEAETEELEAAPRSAGAPLQRRSSLAADAELMAIFERTYGPVKQREFRPQSRVITEELNRKELWPVPDKSDEPVYLLVDGYNIIHAWEELDRLAKEDLDIARQILMDRLCHYRSFTKNIVILVFDAYRVPRDQEDVLQYHNITVVFTKQAETADTYIERATYEIAKKHRVRVATSDSAEQIIVMGHGAVRVTPTELQMEVEQVMKQLQSTMESWNDKQKNKYRHNPFRSLDKS